VSAGFTPGPWHADFGETFRIREGDGSSVAYTQFVHLRGRRDTEEVTANARLIAAAPDGYDVAGAFIMAAINEWDIPEGRETDEGWLCDTLGHALAGAFLKAIAFRAKARGEQ
jgi:hypothetical protein